jgi:hypothetical protein
MCVYVCVCVWVGVGGWQKGDTRNENGITAGKINVRILRVTRASYEYKLHLLMSEPYFRYVYFVSSNYVTVFVECFLQS